MGLFDKRKETEPENRDVHEGHDVREVADEKLLLHREELDIAKDRVHKGEVILSKEIVEERKAVHVPVTHEEVIIERRALNNEHSDSPIGEEQVIHIPVSEERVEVGKHTVLTGEVSAHKREVEEVREIEETLRREEARVATEGEPNVIEGELH